MRKICILILALCGLCCSNFVQAQTSRNGPKLGLGADFYLPVGANNSGADFGLGGSLLFQSPLAEQLRLTIDVCYIRFSGGQSEFVGIKYREGYVPIKAGLRYNLGEYLYGSAEAGVALPTANGSGRGTAFAYSPGVGAEIPLPGRQSLDFGLRYEGWARSNGTRSFAAVRAGFNF